MIFLFKYYINEKITGLKYWVKDKYDKPFFAWWVCCSLSLIMLFVLRQPFGAVILLVCGAILCVMMDYHFRKAMLLKKWKGDYKRDVYEAVRQT